MLRCVSFGAIPPGILWYAIIVKRLFPSIDVVMHQHHPTWRFSGRQTGFWKYIDVWKPVVRKNILQWVIILRISFSYISLEQPIESEVHIWMDGGESSIYLVIHATNRVVKFCTALSIWKDTHQATYLSIREVNERLSVVVSSLTPNFFLIFCPTAGRTSQCSTVGSFGTLLTAPHTALCIDTGLVCWKRLRSGVSLPSLSISLSL